MSFTYRDATFRCNTLMLGLAGCSGSGKTMSALRIATGLSPDKPIYFIDTENGRSLLYAKKFKFRVLELDAPFSPARYMEAIEAASKEGAGAIIVDSASHEHEGAGGILEMHETELTRMAGNDWNKREKCKFSAWIKPKAEHNKFVNRVLQIRSHMIFCFRAKDKLALVKNDKGKQEPVSIGWTPICADRFDYETTTMLVLPPNSGGRPDLSAQATKMNDDLRAIFRDGEQLTESHGRALRQWVEGGSETIKTEAPPSQRKRTWADLVAAIGAASMSVEIADALVELRESEDVKFAITKGSDAVRNEVHAILAEAESRIVSRAEDYDYDNDGREAA